jgi:hypothetical protein
MDEKTSNYLITGSIILIVFIFLIIVTIGLQVNEYGCLSPEWKIINNISLSSYSCEDMKNALILDIPLTESTHVYTCPNKIKTRETGYFSYKIKEEYSKRCLN